jgi:hypothetical protein
VVVTFFWSYFGLYFVAFSGLFKKDKELILLLLSHIFCPSLFARFLHNLDRSLKLGDIKHVNPLEQLYHEDE